MTRAQRRLGGLCVLSLFVFLSVFAFVAGVAPTDPELIGFLSMALIVPAAPAASRLWGRKREPMKTFVPAPAASTVSISKIPRYPRTILGFMLQRGGTTFGNVDLARVELFLAEKSIWGPVSGVQLAAINRYIHGDLNADSFFTTIDFTNPNVKEIGGEQIGGLDLTTLPDGELRLEVELASTASAPTLIGQTIWSAPQGGGALGGLMLKLIRRIYPQAAAGDFFPDVVVRGAIMCRQFLRYTVAPTGVTTAAGISEGANTGNGTFGTINAAADTPCGRYRLKMLAATTFILYAPLQMGGRVISIGTTGVAFNAGGISFTLTAGGTAFVIGDGFYIDILNNNADGNLNLLEIKKNEDIWYSRTDRAGRFEQQRYGRMPVTQMYVADFLLDNHADSVIDTANALTLDYKLNFTSADTLTVIHQVLAKPLLF